MQSTSGPGTQVQRPKNRQVSAVYFSYWGRGTATYINSDKRGLLQVLRPTYGDLKSAKRGLLQVLERRHSNQKSDKCGHTNLLRGKACNSKIVMYCAGIAHHPPAAAMWTHLLPRQPLIGCFACSMSQSTISCFTVFPREHS